MSLPFLFSQLLFPFLFPLLYLPSLPFSFLPSIFPFLLLYLVMFQNWRVRGFSPTSIFSYHESEWLSCYYALPFLQPRVCEFKLSYAKFRDIHFSPKRYVIYILTIELPQLLSISPLLYWVRPTTLQHLENFRPSTIMGWWVPELAGSQKFPNPNFSHLSLPSSCFSQYAF